MEIWDLLDEQGNKTGQTIEKGKVPKGFTHLGADVWIVNSNNEILIQKRSANKRHSPNVWAMTGGSVMAGETSEDTIVREVMEELGIKINKESLQFIKRYKVKHKETPPVFLDTYFIRKDIDISNITMQEDEVSEVKWATWEECEQLYNNGQFLDFRWEAVRDLLMSGNMDKFNIILTSNGFNNNQERSIKIEHLFEKIAKHKNILLIVNATKTGDNYNSIEDIKINFENIGANKVDIIEIDNNNVEKILEYDIIYGVGGDVKELLEDLQKCNFREYLLKFLQKGIYIGESAGSIVLANDIKWCYDIKKGTKPKYDKTLKSYVGIGVTEKNIYPHFGMANDEIKEKIKKYEKHNKIKITPLYDGQFILEYYIEEKLKNE